MGSKNILPYCFSQVLLLKSTLMKKVTLQVQKRKVLGRKVKQLRREGILPANIYGKKIESQAVAVPIADFKKVYKEVGETGVVYLMIGSGKAERPALIHNIQLDAVRDIFLHADFRQVSLKEKVTAGVPVEIKGKAPAEDKGLVLLTLLDEIEVEALPTDLPDKFEVDVSKLEEVDQGISVKDLKFDREKVKPLVESEEELIVKISEPTAEEEEEAPAEKPEGEEEAVAEGEEEGEEGEAKEAPEAKKEGAKEEVKGAKPAEEKKPKAKGKEKEKPVEAKSSAEPASKKA